jgi:signal transduction histidine kinase
MSKINMSPDEFVILLIDDDEDDYVHIRDLFKEISNSRYVVVWKSNYQDGLKTAAESKVDACLLDYRLGAQTGLDFLNEAKRLEVNFPIILLTGYNDLDVDLKAMQIGAADYLIKAQLTSLLLERSIRYSMKQALDMQELKENKAMIIQQDRLASIGLLASSLAHEIGTPLGIIRSRAELVSKKTEEEWTKQDMGIVVTQIDRISKLVNSLLHLAREKKSSLATSVRLSLVMDDILNLMQHEFNRKDILLDVIVDEKTYVKAESGPLGQVFLNLLVNAVHSIEEARKLGRTEHHRVVISSTVKNQSVEISVSDTGVGIPAHFIEQLFKPFFTTKEIGVGTGLGLATSFKFIQSWGGSITAKNNSDVGASFILQLKSGQ